MGFGNPFAMMKNLNGQLSHIAESSAQGKKHNACNLEDGHDHVVVDIQNGLEFPLLSPQAWNLNPNDIILKTIDALKSLTLKKPRKTPTYRVKKFQDVQFMKMPWVEAIFCAIRNLSTMKCKVYTKIEQKKRSFQSQCRIHVKTCEEK